MQNVRKYISKAIAEAVKVRDALDSERKALVTGDNDGMTEAEFDWRFECLEAERAHVSALINELYDVLGHTPTR